MYFRLELKDKWTKAIYLCENSYYMMFYFTFIIIMLGYMYTYFRIHYNPQIILDVDWYRFQTRKQIVLLATFLLLVLNGFVISLYSLLAEAFITYPNKAPKADKSVLNLEKNLNINYRGDEIVNAVLILIFIVFFLNKLRKRQSKISIANKLLKKLDKKAKKFGDICVDPEG